MITREELLNGRDVAFPEDFTKEISANIDQLLEIINQVRAAYGSPMTVSSGWRPPSINASTPGAAPKSNHMKGLAVDIRDTDGSLWQWTMGNLDLMQRLGIFLEDRRWTPSWVHYQIVPPKSQKRIFVPSSAAASDPNAWDGAYDAKYDEAA